MSFIAYPFNLENSIKLITCNKLVNFSEGLNDKPRIYLSGTSIMSIQLNVSMENSKKICKQLDDLEITEFKVRRFNILEK